jgi:hypothetical protein
MFAAIDAHSPIAESGLFADAALSHFHSRLLLPSAGFQPCPPISHLCGRQKKREKQRREKVKDDESAFKGMPDYERKQLNSCYSSYLSRCKYKKIDPISKTKFRNYIEVQVSKFIENTWSQTGAIKNYIKNNCEKIQ